MNEKDTHNEPRRENIFSDSLRATPFSIPKNFFEAQEEMIQARLTLEKQGQSPESASYSVPKGYFDQLEEQILTGISESKLKEQAAILDYKVSEEYFETLETSIQTRIAELKLKESVSEEGFYVPQAYFVQQEEALHAIVSEENLKSKVAEDGFSTPSGYFDGLASNIQSAISVDQRKKSNQTEETIIVPISKKSNWLSYASAAAVVFIIGVGSYFALHQGPKSTTISVAQSSSLKVNLSDVSNDEIVDYLAQVSEGDELIHLTRMLEQETSSPNQIDKAIGDEDIKEYLNYML